MEEYMYMLRNRAAHCIICEYAKNGYTVDKNQNCCLVRRLMVLGFCFYVQQTGITWHNFSTVSKIKYAVPCEHFTENGVMII